MLNREQILFRLSTRALGRNLFCLPETDSTFHALRELAVKNAPHGTVVTAEAQTAGRGRFDRKWESPEGQGLYFNLLLRPNLPPALAARFTHACALGVAEGLRSLGFEAGIKWPNDIILHGRKVCGMLAELSLKGDRIDYISIGIGLNIKQTKEDFPSELWDKAGSLQMFSDLIPDREIILCTVLENLETACTLCENDPKELLRRYRALSVTLGREVLASGGSNVQGIAEDIDENGALLVRDGSSVLHTLNVGDVSVRGVMGYV